MEHHHEVPPGEGVVPAEEGGADPVDDPLLIAVFHRVVGPVVGAHVVVDVGHGHLDGLLQSSGGKGDRAGAGGRSGGEEAAGIHRADLALDSDGDRLEIPQGGAAPPAAGDSQLDLVAGARPEGGEGAAAPRPGDGEGGELVHHMDLGGPLQGAGA